MNIFKVSPNAQFIEVVADYILENHSSNIAKLKVILPNGFLCLHLQQLLVKKLGVTLLPSIVPISNITPGEEGIFKLPVEELGTPSFLEEKVILSNIINSYRDLQFDIAQSMKLSPMLANLFYELSLQEISIESINEISGLDQSEHWQLIYNFLKYAYAEWSNAILALGKIDRARYLKSNFNEEIQRVTKSNTLVIVAGIIGGNDLVLQFLRNIANLPNGFVILPPIAELDSIKLGKLSFEHPLYCFSEFLKLSKKTFEDLPYLSLPKNDKNYLNSLLYNQQILTSTQIELSISYYEYDNIYYEAEAVSLMCRDFLNQNPGKKIALIVNDYNQFEIYLNFLRKYGLNYQNLLGKDLLKNNCCSFIIELSIFCCNDFNILQLMAVLKHPLLKTPHIMALEKLLIDNNRFVSNYEQMRILIEAASQPELLEWFITIEQICNINIEQNFTAIFKQILTASEQLAPNLWNSPEGAATADLFAEILALNWQLNLSEAKNFPDILKSLILGGREYDKQQDALISLCLPEDIALLKFDKIFLVNFSESIWPKELPISPWLSRQMEEELIFHTNRIKQGLDFYNFYLLLHNPEITLTRAKKLESKELLASNYFLKLQFALNFYDYSLTANKNDLSILLKQEYASVFTNNQQNLYVESHIFPSQISATDINLLVKSPYNFYAKKILKLRKYQSINCEAQLSEFGTLIHKVIENYTNYNSTNDDFNKIEAFINIGKEVLASSIFPLLTKQLWQIKINAIAAEFIRFNEELKSNAKASYTEVKGSMNLTIHNHNIKITAIADRIDIDHENNATIIDYKTGIVPSIKDVKLGIAPQLLIEALILTYGSFKHIPLAASKKITYVKIASSEPFIQITEIDISQQDLENHFKGLSSLLEFYITEKKYSLEMDLLNFSDYTHLARKLI